MPDGGMLTVRTETETFDSSPPHGLAPGEYVRIAVTDTGMGMEADTLRMAIEPFFSTKSKERGTGLGLSMVHGLAGQLGGAMAIDSTLGVGTRVDLWLPVADGPAPSPMEKQPTLSDPIRPLSVLLVDDEDLVRAATAEMLRDIGHSVEEATNGAQALEKLGDGKGFDAVVTDYMMPAMDGVQLTERVAAIAPNLPVLLITGFIGATAKADHLPRLAKPFSRTELAASLARVVDS